VLLHMTLQLLGKTSADKLYLQIQKEVKELSYSPCLAVILVGEDPASQVYVGKKIKKCAELGFQSRKILLPEDTSEAALLKQIQSLNEDSEVDGILVQLPLPKHIHEATIIECIDAKKDVDVLTSRLAGKLMHNEHQIAPCTPSGIIRMLEDHDIQMEGKDAVVLGRSKIVGLPMSLLLQQAGATVTLCHSKTKDIRSHTKRADIVIVAVGKPEFLGKEDFHKNSVVIDVGIHRREDGSLCGDVRQEEIRDYVAAYSPVPKGVGPMTIAMLMWNNLQLSKLRRIK